MEALECMGNGISIKKMQLLANQAAHKTPSRIIISPNAPFCCLSHQAGTLRPTPLMGLISSDHKRRSERRGKDEWEEKENINGRRRGMRSCLQILPSQQMQEVSPEAVLNLMNYMASYPWRPHLHVHGHEKNPKYLCLNVFIYNMQII